MKRRWVIVAITSMALSGVGTLVRTARENRQLAKDAADFRIRAEQADAEAQFNLGSIYSEGKGVPKDSIEAVAGIANQRSRATRKPNTAFVTC
jgi:TPR repeat protein